MALLKINMCRVSVMWRHFSTTTTRSTAPARSKFFPPKTTPMLLPGTFDGRVAFITGGGTGIGAGMAGMLSQLGANVVIAGRKLDVLQKTADDISLSTKNKVLAVACDIRDPSAVRDAVSTCLDTLGLPTIVVNNAAGNFISPTERLSLNAWRTIIDIVLTGAINVTTDVGKRLIAANEGGAFLNISTVYTKSGSGFVVPSATAKAGVDAMTKSLASEWSRYGLRFNSVALGPVKTKGAWSRLDPTGNLMERVENRVATGRCGEVNEVANLACYLLSDYASWMTGVVVKFDGGEFNYMAGEMNEMMKTTKEEWDLIENMVRKVKGS